MVMLITPSSKPADKGAKGKKSLQWPGS